MGYPIKVHLEFVKLTQNLRVTRDLGVGAVDDVAGAVVLHLREHLRLLAEVANVVFDASHQPIKVSPESRQRRAVEEQQALAAGATGGSRARRAAGAAQGRLALTQQLDLFGAEAELRVWDGVACHGEAARARRRSARGGRTVVEMPDLGVVQGDGRWAPSSGANGEVSKGNAVNVAVRSIKGASGMCLVFGDKGAQSVMVSSRESWKACARPCKGSLGTSRRASVFGGVGVYGIRPWRIWGSCVIGECKGGSRASGRLSVCTKYRLGIRLALWQREEEKGRGERAKKGDGEDEGSPLG